MDNAQKLSFSNSERRRGGRQGRAAAGDAPPSSTTTVRAPSSCGEGLPTGSGDGKHWLSHALISSLRSAIASVAEGAAKAGPGPASVVETQHLGFRRRRVKRCYFIPLRVLCFRLRRERKAGERGMKGAEREGGADGTGDGLRRCWASTRSWPGRRSAPTLGVSPGAVGRDGSATRRGGARLSGVRHQRQPPSSERKFPVTSNLWTHA
jgi:hypothetical protein